MIDPRRKYRAGAIVPLPSDPSLGPRTEEFLRKRARIVARTRVRRESAAWHLRQKKTRKEKETPVRVTDVL